VATIAAIWTTTNDGKALTRATRLTLAISPAHDATAKSEQQKIFKLAVVRAIEMAFATARQKQESDD
jgi:hypothetical protein